ncbi:MAG TPA: 5-oxoprolinase subunit PxpA [Acidimicrobiales bacterium]|nr:5-oxoprolinase subunit PxpA [Acidimicrobiales bacterium]
MSPSRRIDLNADVGEATDPAGIDTERALLGLVTTAHVACGGHAGTDATMATTVAAALDSGVRVGAHPSYPDPDGFGRRPMDIDREELRDALTHQLRALAAVCASAGTAVASVKAHGALYEEVATGGAIYLVLRDVVTAECPPETTLVLPSGCHAMAMVGRDGVPATAEGFCDRAYRPDGGLVDRATPGAVLRDEAEAAGQALSLARGAVCASDGSILTLWVDTLCIHGDSPGAVAIATAARRALTDAGIEVLAPAPA